MILASLVSARALRPSIVLAQKLRGIDTAWNIRKKHVEKEPTAQMPAADQNKTTGILKGVLPTDLIPSLNSYKCNVCGRIYKNRKFLNSHFKKSSNCAAHTSKMPGYLPPEPEPPLKPPKPKKSTAESPHVCVDCNKGFKTIGEYKKHRNRSQKCITKRSGEYQTDEQSLKRFINSLGTDNLLSIEELVQLEKDKRVQDQNRKPEEEQN